MKMRRKYAGHHQRNAGAMMDELRQIAKATEKADKELISKRDAAKAKPITKP